MDEEELKRAYITDLSNLVMRYGDRIPLGFLTMYTFNSLITMARIKAYQHNEEDKVEKGLREIFEEMLELTRVTIGECPEELMERLLKSMDGK